MIDLRPFDGSAGSRNPLLGLYPYEFSFLNTEERTILLRGCGLKKNCRKMPSTFGFSTSGESGNCWIRITLARRTSHVNIDSAAE